mmetsp:Transcript_13227/g.31721  ORF Transcript_13227/g.31721 Transcript_13227/m.31721 type:complete len:80 (-) Transcript_13227:1391-1630(-)
MILPLAPLAELHICKPQEPGCTVKEHSLFLAVVVHGVFLLLPQQRHEMGRAHMLIPINQSGATTLHYTTLSAVSQSSSS